MRIVKSIVNSECYVEISYLVHRTISIKLLLYRVTQVGTGLHYSSLWAGNKHYRHLENLNLSSLCSIVYNVIRWSLCEVKRDLLYLLYVCL